MTPAKILKRWVKLKHKGQLIRRTKKPYFDHLLFVAKTAGKAVPFGYEVGLCHDLLEDTETTAVDLRNALQGFGYTYVDSAFITACVVELTDAFTKKAHPHLSKASRKEKEAVRLTTISPAAQTIKYADLIYNVKWVLKYDREKALAYLKKKLLLLSAMNAGDAGLHQRAIKLIERSIFRLAL